MLLFVAGAVAGAGLVFAALVVGECLSRVNRLSPHIMKHVLTPPPPPPPARLDPYEPTEGFWRPSGRKAHQAVKDTAETLLSVQEYRPPRKHRTHLTSLGPRQQAQEPAFRAGMEAQRAGRARNSTHWHQKDRKERTALEDAALAAFELGWDTAARGG